MRSLKGWKPSKALLNCPAWALGPKPLRGCWAVWPGWPAAWAGPGFLALGSGVKAIRSGPLGTLGRLSLGLWLVGRLRAAGVSGPYGRPFGLGLLDRGRFLLLGRCLF